MNFSKNLWCKRVGIETYHSYSFAVKFYKIGVVNKEFISEFVEDFYNSKPGYHKDSVGYIEYSRDYTLPFKLLYKILGKSKEILKKKDQLERNYRESILKAMENYNKRIEDNDNNWKKKLLKLEKKSQETEGNLKQEIQENNKNWKTKFKNMEFF